MNADEWRLSYILGKINEENEEVTQPANPNESHGKVISQSLSENLLCKSNKMIDMYFGRKNSHYLKPYDGYTFYSVSNCSAVRKVWNRVGFQLQVGYSGICILCLTIIRFLRL